jgi:hypothetical protein
MKKLMKGERFGSWTVIEYDEDYCLCRCDCGVRKFVLTNNLIRGLSRSCGCLRKKLCGEKFTKHGRRGTRLYTIWCDMKARCNNKNSNNYHNYGGRGIDICEEWKNDFSPFFEWAIATGYNDSLSIDRKNVNGNYEPENCRWVNANIQQRNRRNNHFITYKGKTQTLIEWSNEIGVGHTTILGRLKKGMSIEEVLSPYDLRRSRRFTRQE